MAKAVMTGRGATVSVGGVPLGDVKAMRLAPAPANELLEVHAALDALDVPFGDGLLGRVRALAEDYRRLEASAEAQRTRTDRERLLEALDGDPSELIMLLHDDALDRGPEGEGEARGWGWLASTGRWPVRRSKWWTWWPQPGQSPGTWQHWSCVLPTPLWERLCGSNEGSYPTARAALEAVVGVIARGEWEPAV